MGFPTPYYPQAAQRLLAAFPSPAPAALLESLGGNSPYLAELALAEPEALRAIAANGPDAQADLALGALSRLSPTVSRAQMAAALRQAKRLVSLCAAIGDIGGSWGLGQVTGALSDLADGCLRAATAHLLRAAHDRGDLRLPHPAAPERGSGFTVLAMGKLGARELNFSSDIDLILIYDPAAHTESGADSGAVFARLSRDLVSLMQQRDANGYVFRVDLRLRPDPGSTPPAISLPTALVYYEGAAQSWERAAMIKARPVAGDLALGRYFLAAIRPFVWRRHLDFAALADIRAMKQRIDAARSTALPTQGPPATRILGHNLKIGQGGIREIEFTAQALQLVWGGRNPALRTPATLAALRAAQQAGHIGAAQAQALEAAYRFLRQAEHRLQMVDDRQTHSLPTTPEGLAAFAHFFAAPSAASFATTLIGHLTRVHAAFSQMLQNPPADPDIPHSLPPALPEWHAADGTPPPWQSWLDGRPRALRTDRARDLLRNLLPALAPLVARQPQPAIVWARLDAFFYKLPAGVQILSLLSHNPALLELLAAIMGAAPSLAEHLANVPAALEGLVAPHATEPDPLPALQAQLQDARGVDQALDIASRLVRGAEFSVAVAELEGRLDQDQAGAARTALAEAALRALLPIVRRDHQRRYGRLAGGMVVVALGKAGGREMLVGSDLDLMFIYHHPPDAAESTGPARLPPSQYFGRLAQAMVAALTVPARDGKLYDVDMRLRPSGGKGPVAVSLPAFRLYHQQSARAWERLALTRARVVAGPMALRKRVGAQIKAALCAHNADILAETAAMRARLATELPPKGPWDIKLRAGGLLELEFIAQALQLAHATPRTKLLDPTTSGALTRLAAAGHLPPEQARFLIQADRIWRATQGLLRITNGRTIPQTITEPVARRLTQLLDRLTGPSEGVTVETRLESVAARVRAAFIHFIGEIEKHELG